MTLATLCTRTLARQREPDVVQLFTVLPTHPHVQQLVLALADEGRLTRTVLAELAHSPHAATLAQLRLTRCTPTERTPSEADVNAALRCLPALTSLDLVAVPGLMRPTIDLPSLLRLTVTEADAPTAPRGVQHGREKAAATGTALNPLVRCPALVSARLVLRSPRVLLRQMAALAENSPCLRSLDVAGNVDTRFGTPTMLFSCLEEACFDRTQLDAAALAAFVRGCPSLRRLSARHCTHLATLPDLSFFPRPLSLDLAGTPIDGGV